MTTQTKEAAIKRVELEATIARLEDKKQEYEERLDVGSDKIEQAINQGLDVNNWETYWVGLLRQYEAVVDKLRDSQAELAELQQA